MKYESHNSLLCVSIETFSKYTTEMWEYYVTHDHLAYRKLDFYHFFLLRLVKAIENLQHFSISADPSFRHYQIDVSRELKALSSMDFIQGFYKN